MSINYPPRGATIGYYVYKERLVHVLDTRSPLGSIPCYDKVTPLLGTLYASRDAARRAARKLNDRMSREARAQGWHYDWSTAKESDRPLFKTVPKQLVGAGK
jgi:hypothetical protein